MRYYYILICMHVSMVVDILVSYSQVAYVDMRSYYSNTFYVYVYGCPHSSVSFSSDVG